MLITIKDEVLKDIRKNGSFTNSNGCACGDFVYQLAEKIWIRVSRSCHQASSTPDEKLWQLHDICFYDNIELSYFQSGGKKYADAVIGYGTYLESAKLTESSEKKLIKILKKISKRVQGNEFRNED